MEEYRLVMLGVCVTIYAALGIFLLTAVGQGYVKRYAKSTLFANTTFIRFMGITLIMISIIESICLYIFSTY